MAERDRDDARAKPWAGPGRRRSCSAVLSTSCAISSARRPRTHSTSSGRTFSASCTPPRPTRAAPRTPPSSARNARQLFHRRRAGVPPATAWPVQPEESLRLLAAYGGKKLAGPLTAPTAGPSGQPSKASGPPHARAAASPGPPRTGRPSPTPHLSTRQGWSSVLSVAS